MKRSQDFVGKGELDCLVLIDPSSIRYATGAKISTLGEAIVLVFEDETRILTEKTPETLEINLNVSTNLSFSINEGELAATSDFLGERLILMDQISRIPPLVDLISAELKEKGDRLSKIGIIEDCTPRLFVLGLKKKISGDLINATEYQYLRAMKDSDEVDAIIQAARLLTAAVQIVKEYFENSIKLNKINIMLQEFFSKHKGANGYCTIKIPTKPNPEYHQISLNVEYEGYYAQAVFPILNLDNDNETTPKSDSFYRFERELDVFCSKLENREVFSGNIRNVRQKLRPRDGNASVHGIGLDSVEHPQYSDNLIPRPTTLYTSFMTRIRDLGVLEYGETILLKEQSNVRLTRDLYYGELYEAK
ncbi:MAG: hypothetical protein ACFFCQ_11930 [Promethearchaeota archaeon]